MDEVKTNASSYAPHWERVKGELLKPDMSAHKIAVLEAEKIFRQALSDQDLPGKDIEDQLKNYAQLFRNPDKLKYSRAMYKKLTNKLGFDISEADTRDIVQGYREAVSDLVSIDSRSWSLSEKVSLFLKRNFYNFPGKTKRVVATLLVLSLLTFILTETESGRALFSSWVALNNYVFYKIIPALLILFALSVILIGALYAWQNRNK